jgi:hypothetical protein
MLPSSQVRLGSQTVSEEPAAVGSGDAPPEPTDSDQGYRQRPFGLQTIEQQSLFWPQAAFFGAQALWQAG